MAELGRDYAYWSMEKWGFLAPGLVGICPQGYFVFAPENVFTSEDRGVFDMASKLICVSYQAVGGAIVVEASIKSAPAENQKKVITTDQSSNSGVMIISETRLHSSKLLLKTIRDKQDQFVRLQEDQTLNYQVSSGRYTNFIPAGRSTGGFVEEAKGAIERMGLNVQLYQERPFDYS